MILIQTKSGTSKIGDKDFQASASQVFYSNEVASLPDFQNIYGVGNNLVTDAGTVGNI